VITVRRMDARSAILIALAALGGAGCAAPSFSAQRIAIARDAEFDLLPPEFFGESIALEQLVEARHGTHVSSFHCTLEVDPHALVLVALTPFATRAFVVTLRAGRVEVECATPGALPAEPTRICADLQLALWPALPTLRGLEVVERRDATGAPVRELLRRGQLVIRITYASDVRWRGHLRFEHLEQDYVLDVTTLRAEPLTP
jgi:hypothetical protein